ncbi:MAG TPA: discoidin domain-containing protein, partial [Lentzea sp.]
MGFSSSFEDGQPQPSWVSTVETDAAGQPKSAGVIGSSGTGTPGNVADKATVKANGDNPPNETVAEINDLNVNSKWLVFASTGWVTFDFAASPQTIKKYTISSANDEPERDPKDWTLQGSNNGTDWTVLDTRKDESFAERFQTKAYDIATPASYQHYKLDITANHGTDIVQIAEVELSDGSTTPVAPNMRSLVGSGPTGGYTS